MKTCTGHSGIPHTKIVHEGEKCPLCEVVRLPIPKFTGHMKHCEHNHVKVFFASDMDCPCCAVMKAWVTNNELQQGEVMEIKIVKASYSEKGNELALFFTMPHSIYFKPGDRIRMIKEGE